MIVVSWVLLSCSGDGGGIYAKLANGVVRHNCVPGAELRGEVKGSVEFSAGGFASDGASALRVILAIRFHLPQTLMDAPGTTLVQESATKRFALERSPSRLEVSLVWLLSAVCFVVVLTHFRSYVAQLDAFGDNTAYLEAANAIRHWNFQGVGVKQFWGFPYAIAGLSSLGIPPRASLVVTCVAASLAGVLLAWRLWGPWIAGFFAVINFCWLQVSFLGGSEPLFVALLFWSFLEIRKERWVAAAILAALATVTRPLGIFALAGIALVLLYRRDYTKACVCTLLAACIGGLYLVPFWLYYGDPLYQVHQYKHSDWHSGSAIGFPFRALIATFLSREEPWTNVAFTLGWIFFAIIGFGATVRQRAAPRIREHAAEYIFAFLYLMFLFSYNSGWAWAEFPRFVIPIVPFLLLGVEAWLPKSRYVLYGLAVVSAALGACSAIGIRNVVTMLR